MLPLPLLSLGHNKYLNPNKVPISRARPLMKGRQTKVHNPNYKI
jgi:hypothetical protein